ncbi:Uncharacterized protein BTT61001_02776 [Bacillus thuringiensis]|uniref:Uncharacterized protein n=1 Tax=Bacillus thuringiensis TaxID=1428 RepID=A0A1C4E026_BACTU|nr:Uncharacterized protein BTT61001_02776 [Bacillus thuringiensis]
MYILGSSFFIVKKNWGAIIMRIGNVLVARFYPPSLTEGNH